MNRLCPRGRHGGLERRRPRRCAPIQRRGVAAPRSEQAHGLHIARIGAELSAVSGLVVAPRSVKFIARDLLFHFMQPEVANRSARSCCFIGLVPGLRTRSGPDHFSPCGPRPLPPAASAGSSSPLPAIGAAVGLIPTLARPRRPVCDRGTRRDVRRLQFRRCRRRPPAWGGGDNSNRRAIEVRTCTLRLRPSVVFRDYAPDYRLPPLAQSSPPSGPRALGRAELTGLGSSSGVILMPTLRSR